MRTLYLAIATALMPVSALAINKLTPLYMFGFASSFNDSTVYITEIQRVDSSWIDTKTQFLYSRDNYSFQLRDHLKTDENPFPTCNVFFAEKRKQIEKKYLKLKKRYTTKGSYVVKYIDTNTFHFQGITPDTPEATYTSQQLRAAIKEEKATLKAAKKEARRKAKTDKKEKKQAKQKAMLQAKQRAKELKQKKA
ncbi:MAG: hypothetical protein IJV36_04015 [Prevotella sp.]|nr:hypothetical protein [Prevotella sp.]